MSSFAASCSDTENGAPLFAHPLSCRHTQRALSNVENGHPYSNLFAIEKNVPNIEFFGVWVGFGLVWFFCCCFVSFLTWEEIKPLLKNFGKTSSK